MACCGRWAVHYIPSQRKLRGGNTQHVNLHVCVFLWFFPNPLSLVCISQLNFVNFKLSFGPEANSIAPRSPSFQPLTLLWPLAWSFIERIAGRSTAGISQMYLGVKAALHAFLICFFGRFVSEGWESMHHYINMRKVVIEKYVEMSFQTKKHSVKLWADMMARLRTGRSHVSCMYSLHPCCFYLLGIIPYRFFYRTPTHADS